MSGVETVIVGEPESGQRLDRWFKQRYPKLGHGRLEKLLRTGQVRVDGRRAKAGSRLEAGQAVRIPPLDMERRAALKRPEPPREAAEALRQRVLYKDDWVLAIDKPSGLAVQGGTGQHRHLDALLGALAFEVPEPPRLVHRLDKDTSGVLLLARTVEAARALAAVFQGKAARKLYWAAVAGVPKPARGRIDLPLGKEAGRGGEKVRAGGSEGKAALTLYQCVARHGREAAWLVLYPMTGRTHQLRVHCAAIGHPILGDGKYGGRGAFLSGQGGQRPSDLQLHAREIAFPHPLDGTTTRITAPLPPHMEELWASMGFDAALGDGAGGELEDWAFSGQFPA